jgi:hypothetical protein
MIKMLLAAAVLGAAPELNDESFAGLRDAIRPRASEQSYLEIPWRESFVTALNEARETDRPILLWAMNGHPLGCT